MACDLKPSVERMTEKLQAIQYLAFQGLGMLEERITIGKKWMELSTAISKISVLIRDNSNVEHYWYAKFVEEGVLVQPEEKKCDWDSNRCGSGCLVYDDNVKMSKTIVTLKSEIEELKNGGNTEVR